MAPALGNALAILAPCAHAALLLLATGHTGRTLITAWQVELFRILRCVFPHTESVELPTGSVFEDIYDIYV